MVTTLLSDRDVIMFWAPLWQQIDVQNGWVFIGKGVVLIYALLLCSGVVMAIALERWLYLRLARTDADALYGIVEHMATRQALDRAQAHLQLHTGALAAVLRALLAAQSHDETDLENVAHMQARRELRRLNTRLPPPLDRRLGAAHRLVGDGGRHGQNASASCDRRRGGKPHLLASGI